MRRWLLAGGLIGALACPVTGVALAQDNGRPVNGYEAHEAGEFRATPHWIQAWAASIPWTERGAVYRSGEQARVPANCDGYDLDIDETNQEELDAHQLKYHQRRGVGNIRVGWSDGPPHAKETFELTKLEELESGTLADARPEALRL
jgi:hypothetical protein